MKIPALRAASSIAQLLILGLFIGCRSAQAEITSGTFEITASDTTARFFHRAAPLASGKVLVSGGMGLQFPPSLVSLDDLSFYDPADGSFSSTYEIPGGGSVTPLLSVPRSSHTQTLLDDGRVLFTGGYTGARGTSQGTPTNSVELFIAASGEVVAGPPMSQPRAVHTATDLSDGRVVIAGGRTWQSFDPARDEWSAPQPLARSRIGHAAVLLRDAGGPGVDRVLLIAGGGSGPQTLEIVDPDEPGSTLCRATLAIGVDDLAALAFDDGLVLIVGGQDLSSGDTIDLTWLFDPAGDSLLPLPPPPDRREGIADHQLIGLGRYALVAGGEQQVSGVDTELDYAALFDHDIDDWIYVSSMNFPHDDFAAVRLPDDRVLLIDGGAPLFGIEAPTSNVEIFIPTHQEPSDVDCDGVVSFTDLLIVLNQWGPCPTPPDPCPGDIDGSGATDFGDLLLVLADWS